MADPVTQENFKKVFRVYKGEAECPYTEETLEQRHKWFMWKLEETLANAGVAEILERYYQNTDSIPEEISNADVSEEEKINAFFLYTAADTMMARRAFEEYFSMPIVHTI